MEEVASLTGENLARFLHIQESIRTTRKRVTLGGAPNFIERQFYEEILPVVGSTQDADGSITSCSVSSVSIDEARDSPQRVWELEENRKSVNEFEGRRVADVRSDWMVDDLESTTREPSKNKLSRATESSQRRNARTCTISSAADNPKKPEKHDHKRMCGEIDMRLNERISPEEERKIYELVCDRYGKESGRRYLLVRSMRRPEKKIETWTTTERNTAEEHQFNQTIAHCIKTERKIGGDYICTDISEDVKSKMKSLVEITPFCSADKFRVRKPWKNALRTAPAKSHKMLHVSIKGESPSTLLISDDKSDRTPCPCGLLHCDCDLVKGECDVPRIRKICDVRGNDTDEINNYLITCREILQDKTKQDRRVTDLQQHASNVANRVTTESVYLQSAYEEAECELVTCLMQVMPPGGKEVSDTGFNYVEELANVVAEDRMIDEHEWRVWRYLQAKMDNPENSDELDSIDSDIVTSASSDDEHSEYKIQFSERIQPSRIPYFKETFELASMLFEKIDTKLDKLVAKNHDKNKIIARKPYARTLRDKIKLLKHDNRLFNQMSKEINLDEFYSKMLMPFSVRKMRKRQKANKMKVELNIKKKRRMFFEGLQLGRRYKRPNRSYLYTQKEDYRGFSPKRQRFLRQPGMYKFRKCDLVGSDLSGRRLTKTVIRNDYRLMRRMFDDQLKRNKESLWDPGMKARMEEYMGIRTFKEPQKPEEEDDEELEENVDDLSLTTQRRPQKEEQKTQTALPNSWSYYSRSSGNAAETIATMIRSLRQDGGSHEGLDLSRNHWDSTKAQRPLTPTLASFGENTVTSSRLETTSGQSRTGQHSEDLGPRRHSKSRQVGSYKPEGLPKSRTPNSFSYFEASDVDSSVSRMSHLKRPTATLTKTTKTLPPTRDIRTSEKQPPQKYRLKPSKTVR